MPVNLFQRVVGAAALQNKPAPECFLLVFSPSSQRLILVCAGKRGGQNETDCMGKQVPVDTAARFHARTHWYVRETILYSIRLEMDNQYRDRRTGAKSSGEFVVVTIRAAAFWILCRRFSWLAQRPNIVL